jgi:ribA/ribD-fused uncharacterized protein
MDNPTEAYSREWLIERFNNGHTIKYIFFWGHTAKGTEDVGKFVFSQWYPSTFLVDGVEYKSAEHWMMGQKALLFGDVEMFGRIVKADKPAEVKELGRSIRDFNESVWNTHKFRIVIAGSIHKFNQHKGLLEFLLSSGDRVIVEASPVDRVWGIGLTQDAKRVEDPNTWRGENLLGFALMAARDFLRQYAPFEYPVLETLPPWKAHPGIPHDDMFWKSKEGAETLTRFHTEINSRNDFEKKLLEIMYPAYWHWVERHR